MHLPSHFFFQLWEEEWVTEIRGDGLIWGEWKEMLAETASHSEVVNGCVTLSWAWDWPSHWEPSAKSTEVSNGLPSKLMGLQTKPQLTCLLLSCISSPTLLFTTVLECLPGAWYGVQTFVQLQAMSGSPGTTAQLNPKELCWSSHF